MLITYTNYHSARGGPTVMALREINATLKQALIDNVPFTYAHLLKFERPTKVAQYLGVASTDSKNYTYITDAPYDIVFDDGDGNGPQVYRANKLVKAGSVNETIKAKASSIKYSTGFLYFGLSSD